MILFFSDVKYIHDLSEVRNLGVGRDAEKHLETVKTYVEHYLTELARGGYGIIKTVPTFVENSLDPFAFTDVAYKILTKDEITVAHYISGKAASDTPIVVIYGVCTRRPLPVFITRWSLGWLPSGGAKNTVGTVWFSKETFLEKRLLHVLEEFNARTTIVPKFAGIVDGSWKCDLSTWEKHESRGARGERCTWQSGPSSSPRHLEYVWEHRDDWNYERDGTLVTESTGEYSLLCEHNNPS